MGTVGGSLFGTRLQGRLDRLSGAGQAGEGAQGESEGPLPAHARHQDDDRSPVQSIRALGEKPIIIGHSFGGLLTQLMVQRDLAAAAVVIDSVAPPGVLSSKWSFYKGTWPVLNPFAGSRPYYMSFRHYQYAFANDQTLAEQRAGYELDIVPESRRLARGALTLAAKIDFKRPHAPLLFIAGERDHLMPASLNRSNYERFKKSPSPVEFKQFADRGHYSIIGGEGWQEVADYALAWAQRSTRTDHI